MRKILTKINAIFNMKTINHEPMCLVEQHVLLPAKGYKFEEATDELTDPNKLTIVLLEVPIEYYRGRNDLISQKLIRSYEITTESETLRFAGLWVGISMNTLKSPKSEGDTCNFHIELQSTELILQRNNK